jgi:hypothetical protein
MGQLKRLRFVGLNTMKKGLRAALAALLIMVCLLFATPSDLKAASEMPELQWSKSARGCF